MSLLFRFDGMRILSVANRRENWRMRRKRERPQADEVAYRIRENKPIPLPVVVTMVRYGPRLMDDDNLQLAFKHVRDAIASELLPRTQANQYGRRGDDSDARIRWQYGQRRFPRYGMTIGIANADGEDA